MLKFLLFFGLILLCGCTLSSPEDFHYEGEAHCKALVKDLKKIHTKDELIKAVPKLRKKYSKIANLVIAGQEFQKKHPDLIALGDDMPNPAAEELREQIDRIYQIAGAREIMEKAQSEALHTLDHYAKPKNLSKDAF